MKCLFQITVLLVLVVSQVKSVTAQQELDRVTEQSWIVQLNSDFNVNRDNFLTKSKVSQYSLVPLFPALNIYELTVASDSGFSYSDLSLDANVLTFEADYKLQNRAIPNDTEYSSQWGPDIIEATRVWDVTTGGITPSGTQIVVAVIDDGYDTTHADIRDNYWDNPNETFGDSNSDGCPGDCGVDDDGDGLIDEDDQARLPGDPNYDPSFAADDDENGFIDDFTGANIRQANGVHELKSHGTAVAGIIGAKGDNNLGVSGINWDVKLMLFSETKRVSDLIKAYNYIYEERKKFNESNGSQGSYVVVSNLSSGIDGRFADEFPNWCAVYDKLGEQGVLNVCSTTNDNVDIDLVGDMPSTCTSPYLIAVNNTTIIDEIAESTGQSATHIDIGAPGSGTYTAAINSLYGTFGGTSAAAPHVAGAIALLYSSPCDLIEQESINNPSQIALNMRRAILDGVTPLSTLSDVTSSGGRLNVYNSLLELQGLCEGTKGDLAIEQVYYDGANISVTYETPQFDSYQLMISDTAGKVYYRQTITPNLFGNKIEIISNLSLASGIYNLSIFDSNEIVTKQFYLSR